MKNPSPRDWEKKFDEEFSGCKDPDYMDRLLCTFDSHHVRIKAFIRQVEQEAYQRGLKAKQVHDQDWALRINTDTTLALAAYKDKLRKSLAELREHNPFPDKVHSIVNLETGGMKPDPAYKQRGFMESGGYHSALDDVLKLLDEK